MRRANVMKKGRGRLIEAPGLTPDRSLTEQIAAHLRNLIVTRAIAPGARLPGQRMMAADLKVSRNTVLSVLEQLEREGLVESRRGSGTFVSQAPTPYRPASSWSKAPPATTPLSPLDVGEPALDLFPMATWNKLQAQRWRRLPPDALGEGHSGGWHRLRATIAQRAATLRGIACDPGRVVIVPSAQVAVELVARCLAAPGENAWIEDPGYWRGRDALRIAGLKPTPVPVDAEGFDVNRARRIAPARVALVTPARQFPTGVPLSPTRRRALLDWARREQGWVIEDDFESDFCFEGRLPSALASEAEGGERVVYVSTFATTLFPALRVAYLIAPDTLVDRILAARAASDRTMSVPVQMVLQDFMEQGHLAAHVRACRDVYAQRREALVDALNANFGRECDIFAPAVGLHVLMWLREGRSDKALRDAAKAEGVVVSAISDHAVLPPRPGLFLGFAPYQPAQIRRAVDGLRVAYEKWSRSA